MGAVSARRFVPVVLAVLAVSCVATAHANYLTQELDRQWHAMYETFDKDRDGYLNHAELQHLAAVLGNTDMNSMQRALREEPCTIGGPKSIKALTIQNKECCDIYVTHPTMVIGSTWGNLAMDKRRWWAKTNCDEISEGLRKARAHFHRSGANVDFASFKQVMLKTQGVARHKTIAGDERKACRTFLRGKFHRYSVGCCNMYVTHPSMKIGQTWGDLPQSQRAVWTDHKCDEFASQLARVRAEHEQTVLHHLSKRVVRRGSSLRRDSPLLGSLVGMLADAPTDDLSSASPSVKSVGEDAVASAIADVDAEMQAADTGERSALERAADANPFMTREQRSAADRAEGEIEEDQREADSDHSLTNEVLFSMRKEHMNDLDANGDGKLSRAELTAQVRRAWHRVQRMREEELHERERPALQDFIDSIDHTYEDQGQDSRAVSFQQLFGSLEQGNAPGDIAVDDRLQHDRKRARSAFDYADENHDGVLNVDELFRFFNPRAASETSRREHERFLQLVASDEFAEADSDANDKVSREEFGQWVHNIAHGPLVAHDLPQFDTADADGSGDLDRDEFSRLVQRHDALKYNAPVRELLRVADDNHDGKLSLPEIRRHARELTDTPSSDFLEK